ncbi:MAG: hypothetical protein LV480_05480 [Methylacidiphilales bacterium]|nr:hypothetical protein [Candidatus Methylacidiphilales bacterium]
MNEPTHRPDADLDALFALARAHRPDTSAAEFAFETRLMARLRAREETGSIWAMVSWRLIPFFAVGVVGLAIWRSEISSETTDAAAVAGLDNPVASDLWEN